MAAGESRGRPAPGRTPSWRRSEAPVRHAAKVRVGQAAAQALREESVARGAASVRAAAELDPRLGELASRLELLEQEASDAAADLRRYTDTLDADPSRLEAIESRLAVLDGIKRKHGGTIESAMDELGRLRKQVDATEDLGSAIAAAERERDRSRAELEAGAARRPAPAPGAAERMQAAVTAELTGLSLEGSFCRGASPAAGRGLKGLSWRDDVLSQPPASRSLRWPELRLEVSSRA